MCVSVKCVDSQRGVQACLPLGLEATSLIDYAHVLN